MKEKEKNDKVLQIVEQQYQSFINLEDKWDFFRGLAEYTKTLQEMAQTKPFIEVLEAQRKANVMVYEQMNTDAMKEFINSAQKIIPIAQDIFKSQEPFIKQSEELSKKLKPALEAIQEVRNRLSGNILSSDPLCAFDRDLFDVARLIKENGHEEAIKEFEDNKKRYNNIYGNYTFSPTYEKIDEERKRIERKEQVEPWGAWHQLPIVKRLIFEPEEIKSEFKLEADNDPSLKWTWLNFIGIAGEIERIRKGEASDDDVYYFSVKDFKNYAQRVHIYITKELHKINIEENNIEQTKKTKEIKFNLSFAMQTGIMTLTDQDNNKYTISVQGQVQKEVLRVIFRNPEDTYLEWSLYDISVALGEDDVDTKAVKNAIYQFSRKVKLNIPQLENIFELTKHSAKLNPKYISKT